MAGKAKTDSSPLVAAARMSDVAYERILEGLFDRRVPAGAFISQNELSAIVDVPVAPLRDALRVLEAEAQPEPPCKGSTLAAAKTEPGR